MDWFDWLIWGLAVVGAVTVIALSITSVIVIAGRISARARHRKLWRGL